jgi:hypothetical protein
MGEMFRDPTSSPILFSLPLHTWRRRILALEARSCEGVANLAAAEEKKPLSSIGARPIPELIAGQC